MKKLALIAAITVISILTAFGNDSFAPSDTRAKYGWTKSQYHSIIVGITAGEREITNKYGAEYGETFNDTMCANVTGMSYDDALNYIYASRKEFMARLANTFGH
jgi:hypothetical protein